MIVVTLGRYLTSLIFSLLYNKPFWFDSDLIWAFNQLTEEPVKTFQAVPNQSCDLDPLPTSLLKECIDLFVLFLTKLFNLSLTNSTVPQKFIVAHITLIVKKSDLDPDQPENYRPISNLPFLSKVLERVVFSQIEH